MNWLGFQIHQFSEEVTLHVVIERSAGQFPYDGHNNATICAYIVNVVGGMKK